MLKRNDLAKQFELVVQQEIINHNEQILASNLSINEMRILIDDMQQKQDLVNQSLSSTISRMNQNGVDLSESVLRLSKQISSISNDFNDFREKSKNDVKLLVENAVSEHAKNEKSLKIIKDLQCIVKCLESSFVGLSFRFFQEIQDESKELKKEIEKSKKEILSLPSEAQLVKKDLEDRFAISRVDIQGLKKEIELLKKDSFIIEKHVEHLFTQIERMKVGKL